MATARGDGEARKPAITRSSQPDLAHTLRRAATTPAATWEAAPGADLMERFDAVPSNHSPHFAPDLSTVAPGVRTLVSGAPTYLVQNGVAC
ncbi:hypothetical protein QFZ32_004619 [Streptomyces canus]|nr:hypothetical protein [Streptomyces canus]